VAVAEDDLELAAKGIVVVGLVVCLVLVAMGMEELEPDLVDDRVLVAKGIEVAVQASWELKEDLEVLLVVDPKYLVDLDEAELLGDLAQVAKGIEVAVLADYQELAAMGMEVLVPDLVDVRVPAAMGIVVPVPVDDL